jgi:flagellar motor switch/type III secretory pathway protein FliN
MFRRPLAAYPWASLPSLRREACRASRAARVALQPAPELSRVEAALHDVLRVPADVVVHELSFGSELPAEPVARVRFLAVDGSLELTLAADPALVTFALARTLEQPTRLDDVVAELDDRLRGAYAAVALEVIRRATPAPLAFFAAAEREAPAQAQAAACVLVRMTVLLDGRRFALLAHVSGRFGQRDVRSPAATLVELGALVIELPVVSGLCVLTRRELALLRPGDAVLPGSGLWIDGSGKGRGVIAAKTAETGCSVEITGRGSLVLLGERVTVTADSDPPDERRMDEPDATLAQALIDAPVVIRIEVASVSMPAREWAQLKPGDVIETGQLVAEPVVLRVAGLEVATGELVSVDGELGVRIRSIRTGGER